MYKTMTIALCAILHLTVVAVADQNPKANLVYRSTLDSESAVTSPVVGASGTCTGATFVDGKFGKALYVPAHTSVARIPLSDGLPTTKGCIGFWAKLQEGKSTFGDGGDPIFLRILRADEKEFSTFEYNSNNGGGGGGVWSRLPGLSIASHECSWTMNYSTVLGEDYASWHHYALVWNVDGIAALEDSSRAAILIDGKVVARANGGDSWDRDGFLTKMAQSLTVTFCYPGAGWGKSAFAIDELSIWDSDAVLLQDMIPGDSQDLESNDNLVYRSTLDSESAVTSPMVGASGTCTDATFVDGKFGKALYVPAGASVATIPLPDGLPTESGCIEFWAKINTTSTTFGDGGNPTFISVNRVDTGGLICTLHFNANDGGGRGGLCVGLCNLSAGTDTWSGYKSYSSYISGAIGDWHHYAIVWNVDGIAYVEGNPRLVVLLDGESMITANGDSTWSKEVFVDRMSLPLNINLSTTKPNESRKPYLIDELRIWKTDAAAFGGLPKYANATYVYDGKAHSLGAPLGASGTEVFGYSLSESGPFADEMPTLTNVGTMRVWYSVTANGKSSVSSATVTVSKRTVVFTSASAEKQYDGTPLSADSVSIKGEVPDGEGFSFTVTGERTVVGESDNVFTWTANKGTNPDNYNVKLVYGKLAVTMDESSGVQSYEIISSSSGGEAVRITRLSYPDGGDVTLPDAVCGLPVAEFAADALSGSSVSGVRVPAGVSAPGTLFANLENLTNVSFAADCNVTSAFDFRGSAALREVVLPAQVVLAPWAFLGCWDLERVVFSGEPPFGGKVDGMALQTLLLASTSPASLLQMADMICYPEACAEKWEKSLRNFGYGGKYGAYSGEWSGVESLVPGSGNLNGGAQGPAIPVDPSLQPAAQYAVQVGRKEGTVISGAAGWDAISLPDGMSWDRETGALGGTPRRSGTYDVILVSGSGAATKMMRTTVDVAGYAVTTGYVGVAFKASGAPWDALDSYKTVPAGLAWKNKTLSGVPTKAGSWSYKTTDGEPVKVEILALPAGAKGTYNGVLVAASGKCYPLKVSATAAGKLSATVVKGTKTYSLSAAKWSSVKTENVEGAPHRMFSATLTATGISLAVKVDADAAWNADALVASGTLGAVKDLAGTAQRNAFESDASASAVATALAGVYKLSAQSDGAGGWLLDSPEAGTDGAISVTLKSTGAASVSGTLPDKTKLNASGTLHVAIDGSATLRFYVKGVWVVWSPEAHQ